MPRQKLLGSIDIFEQSMVATVYSGDGKGTTSRFVTAADIARMIKLASGKALAATRWLPLGENAAAVGIDRDGGLRYVIVRPARRSVLMCQVGKRRFTLKVNMPNLVTVMTARSGKSGLEWRKIEGVYCFGGRASALSVKTQLRVAPVPNMYEDGTMCNGDVNMKALVGMPPAEAFERAFLKSTFTDHSLTGPLASTRRYRNILDAIRRTRGNVPLTALVKVKKYGEILKDGK